MPFDELLCAMGKPLFNFQFDSNHQSSIVLPYHHHKLSKYFRIAELGEFFSSPKNCDIIINIFFNCFKMVYDVHISNFQTSFFNLRIQYR